MGKASVALSVVLVLSSASAFAEDRKPYPMLARIHDADALVKKGELTRARAAFIRLHKITAGETRTAIATRIGAINQTLQLPSTDGLVTPTAISSTLASPKGAAFLDQARDAFDQGDYKLALTLAQKSATAGGSTDAKILYSDSLFRLGEYHRAKMLYIALYKAATGSVKYTMAKKVALANAQLHLSTFDGLPPDLLLDVE